MAVATKALSCQMDIMKTSNMFDALTAIKDHKGILTSVKPNVVRCKQVYSFEDNSRLSFYPATSTLAYMCATIV